MVSVRMRYRGTLWTEHEELAKYIDSTLKEAGKIIWLGHHSHDRRSGPRIVRIDRSTRT